MDDEDEDDDDDDGDDKDVDVARPCAGGCGMASDRRCKAVLAIPAVAGELVVVTGTVGEEAVVTNEPGTMVLRRPERRASWIACIASLVSGMTGAPRTRNGAAAKTPGDCRPEGGAIGRPVDVESPDAPTPASGTNGCARKKALDAETGADDDDDTGGDDDADDDGAPSPAIPLPRAMKKGAIDTGPCSAAAAVTGPVAVALALTAAAAAAAAASALSFHSPRTRETRRMRRGDDSSVRAGVASRYRAAPGSRARKCQRPQGKSGFDHCIASAGVHRSAIAAFSWKGTGVAYRRSKGSGRRFSETPDTNGGNDREDEEDEEDDDPEDVVIADEGMDVTTAVSAPGVAPLSRR